METSPLLFSSSFLFFISFSLSHLTLSSGADDCRPSSCSPTGPQIRFPFRLTGKQPDHCGYQGFSLSCNTRNQTLLALPTTNESIIVNRINYVAQIIYIEPQFCTPGRISTFNLARTPFDSTIMTNYTFFNCSSAQNSGYMYPAVPFGCLSGENYSVIAIRSAYYSPGEMPENCRRIAEVSVPRRRFIDIRGEIALTWFTPFCVECEIEGKSCRLEGDDGGIGCSAPSSRGLPRSAKYGLSIGIGIPALVCIIGILCYTGSKVRDYNQSHHQSIDHFSIAITPHPNSLTGLDGPTIESYPKTVLGESCRLPNPNDGTCPICLSDYQPKEALRTIPECNHYFHAECIDEWLKLNATCPVCRNSPESSSLVTPCLSMSSDSLNSS